MSRMRSDDQTLFGWEAEYDDWLKRQLEERNIANMINYETSHKLGKLASPTPDHFCACAVQPRPGRLSGRPAVLLWW